VTDRTTADRPARSTSTPAPGLLRGLLRDPKHGPLPAALLTLTIVTGLVDAVSILALGRVFVANMTGNVVFIGFAIAGAPGFSLAASLSALAGFLVGAAAGGRLIKRYGENRRDLLTTTLAFESVLILAALVAAAASGASIGTTARDGIAATLAIALGWQNAVVRQLKVPDLTTTVLTMTLTGIAADLRSEPSSVIARRILAVLMMLGGAAVGALLVIHVSTWSALALAAGFTVAALLLTRLHSSDWT
jgi:uncharacterized membrane protein YoaK (UPF0700 family)